MQSTLDRMLSYVGRSYAGTNNIPPEVAQSLTLAAAGGASLAQVRQLCAAYRQLTGNSGTPIQSLFRTPPPEGFNFRDWFEAQRIALRTHDIPTPPTRDLWATDSYIENDALRLNQVLEAVRESAAKGERPVVVFDLDDTLQPTRPRELRIFHEYAREHNIPRLLGMQMGHIVGWDLNHMLVDLMKFHPAWARVHAPLMRQHWNPRFFSNEYLADDPAFEGAADYVTALKEAGATIIYMTGRDSIDMQSGTIESLHKNGFPVPVVQNLTEEISVADRVLLFMKPISNQQIVAGITDEKDRTALIKASDVDYKKKVMEMLKTLNIVASFENEPFNANAFRENLHGRVLLIRTKAANAALPLAAGVEEFLSWKRSA